MQRGARAALRVGPLPNMRCVRRGRRPIVGLGAIVTDGIESAVNQAKAAAAGKSVGVRSPTPRLSRAAVRVVSMRRSRAKTIHS